MFSLDCRDDDREFDTYRLFRENQSDVPADLECIEINGFEEAVKAYVDGDWDAILNVTRGGTVDDHEITTDQYDAISTAFGRKAHAEKVASAEAIRKQECSRGDVCVFLPAWTFVEVCQYRGFGKADRVGCVNGCEAVSLPGIHDAPTLIPSANTEAA